MRQHLTNQPLSHLARLLVRPAALTMGAVLLAFSAAAPVSSRAAATPRAVSVTVFAPRPGDVAGVGGKGFVVDLALQAAPGHDADLVGAPRFIAPTDPLFKPGANPAVPGLVVTLSSDKKHANLANLFQLTGVARVDQAKQVWATWLVGKPLFGVGVDSTLTVYVMKGQAPAVAPPAPPVGALLSDVNTVPFHIAGPVASAAARSTPAGADAPLLAAAQSSIR